MDYERQDRAFTLKAILFGLLGVFLIAGLAGFNDNRLEQNLMIGNHFPIGGYFYLVFLALVWNLVFSRVLPALTLNSKELVVVMAMTLAACFVPTSGLLRYFPRQIILPWYYEAGKADWQKFGVLDYLPKKLFPLGAEMDETVYRGFIQGMAKGNETVGVADLPLAAWMPPLAYWAPFIILMSACVMALALLVHRQWVHHEQLSYPLATVARSLFFKSPSRRVADLFYSKLFWWGVVVVLFIYVIKYLSLWFPGYVPDVPLTWDIGGELRGKFPVLNQVSTHSIEKQTLFFTVVGLAYFIPAEMSLSMGLTSLLLCFIGIQFYTATGKPIPYQDMEVFRGGAYFGYALVLFYTGRSYFRAVFLRAFGIGRPSEHQHEAVLAARIVMLSFAGMVGVLTMMGLDWFIALLFAATLMLVFLVFTRIICETGIPFLELGWNPGIVMTKVLGPTAVGAGPLVFIYYLSTILTYGIRECLMPYVATSLKVAEDSKVRRAPLLGFTSLAVVVALVLGFVVTMYFLYNFGALSADRWAHFGAPQTCFDDATRAIQTLSETGQLAGANATAGLHKLTKLAWDGHVMTFLLSGLACVLVFAMLRFRFAKCPIHPVLFLVWGMYASENMWYSFLLGWAIKTLVVKFGGGKAFQNLKPLFIGLVIGELLAGAMSIITAFIYYFMTNTVPPTTTRLIVLPI